MDSSTGGAVGIIAFLFSSAGLIYAAINHKKIRCKCCGKDMDMSIDVDTTDPPVPVPEPEPEETLPPPPPTLPRRGRRNSLPPLTLPSIKKVRSAQVLPEQEV